MKLGFAPLLAALCVGLFSVAPLRAQAPADVYLQVNKDLNDYKAIETIYEVKEGVEPFAVKAWFQDSTFRRVKASQTGEGGVMTRDFYYDGQGELKFALVTLSSDEKETPKPPVEERFDFEDGKLVRYLGPSKKPIAKEDKAFAEMETALVSMSEDLKERIEGSTAYVGMIGGVDDPDHVKAPAGTVFGAGYSDGTFSDVEEADYFHLDLKQADGGIETFFVIKPDASVEPFIKEPAKSKGTKIRIHWTEKMQDIPEGGGATRLKICDRIEVLK